jgi:hypothetical protein
MEYPTLSDIGMQVDVIPRLLLFGFLDDTIKAY